MPKNLIVNMQNHQQVLKKNVKSIFVTGNEVNLQKNVPVNQ